MLRTKGHRVTKGHGVTSVKGLRRVTGFQGLSCSGFQGSGCYNNIDNSSTSAKGCLSDLT